MHTSRERKKNGKSMTINVAVHEYADLNNFTALVLEKNN